MSFVTGAIGFSTAIKMFIWFYSPPPIQNVIIDRWFFLFSGVALILVSLRTIIDNWGPVWPRRKSKITMEELQKSQEDQ